MIESDIPGSENNMENCKYIWYLITNTKILLYLIWYFWHQDIKLKNSMEKKNSKKRAGKYAEYQGGKKAEICVKLHISFFLQGIKMWRSTKEAQKTDIWSDKKKIQQLEKQNSLLFFIKFCFKKIYLKINW